MADLCSGSNFIKHYLKRESLAELEEKVMGNKKKQWTPRQARSFLYSHLTRVCLIP